MVSLVRVAITGGKGATINNTKGVYLFVGGGVLIIVVALYLLFSPSRTTPASPKPNYSQTAVAENEIRKQNAEATRTANSTPTPTIPPITPTPNAYPKMATARAKQGEQILSVTTPSANELTPAQEQAAKELLNILDKPVPQDTIADKLLGKHCLNSDGNHSGFERLVRSTLKHPSSMRTISTIVMPDFGNGEHEIAMQFSAYMDEYGGEKNWIVYGVFDSRTCKASISE